MIRKFLSILLLCSATAIANGPLFKSSDTYVQQEFENVYFDIRNPRIDSGSAKTFSITTGTVRSLTISTMTASSSTITSLTVTNLNGSAYTAITGGQLPATATNDSAAAGKLGEYMSSAVSNQSVGTAGQYNDITSIPLTAGDWIVFGIVDLERNGATFTAVTAFGGISTTSGNSGTGLTTGDTLVNVDYGTSGTTFNGATGVIPGVRMSLSGSATVYLKGYTDGYTAGTPKHYARISAWRAR